MNTGKEVAIRQPADSTDNLAVPKTAQGRLQRMIFVATLYFRLRGVNDPTRAELNEVNARFHLAKDDGTLRFPAAISNIIWGKSDLLEIFARYKSNRESMSALAMELLSNVPRWMKYDDGRELRRDVQAVFECVRKL